MLSQFAWLTLTVFLLAIRSSYADLALPLPGSNGGNLTTLPTSNDTISATPNSGEDRPPDFLNKLQLMSPDKRTELETPEVYVAIAFYLASTVATPKWDLPMGRKLDLEDTDLFPTTAVKFRNSGSGYYVNYIAYTLEDLLVWTIAQRGPPRLPSVKFRTSLGGSVVGIGNMAAPSVGLDPSWDSSRRRDLSEGSIINSTANGIFGTNVSSLSGTPPEFRIVKLRVTVKEAAIRYTPEAVMTTIKDMLMILGPKDERMRETLIDRHGFSLWNPYDDKTDGFTIAIVPLSSERATEFTNWMAILSLGEAIKWIWSTRPVGTFREFDGFIYFQRQTDPRPTKFGTIRLFKGKSPSD